MEYLDEIASWLSEPRKRARASSGVEASLGIPASDDDREGDRRVRSRRATKECRAIAEWALG